jgi:hypothetical protein
MESISGIAASQQGESGGVNNKWRNEYWKNQYVSRFPQSVNKGSLRHAVSTCVYCMRFQSQLGQTKVDFNNQGKNAPQCLAF